MPHGGSLAKSSAADPLWRSRPKADFRAGISAHCGKFLWEIRHRKQIGSKSLSKIISLLGAPNGNRTRVFAVKEG